MKPLFTKLFLLVAFLGLASMAKAQRSAVPDTTRIGAGLDVLFPNGSNLNNGYLFGFGASAQIDIPLTLKWYATGNVGFDSFFAQKSSSANSYAIENVKVPNFDDVPVKVGLKYFLIRTLYLQGEVGETFLVNKDALYAYQSSSLTFAPQIGLLFKLPKRQYIDFGFRYEWFQDVYSDNASIKSYNRFFGFRFAYAFNLGKPQ
jgi:hypothetical protein